MLLPNHQLRQQRRRQATATNIAPQVTESKCKNESVGKALDEQLNLARPAT